MALTEPNDPNSNLPTYYQRASDSLPDGGGFGGFLDKLTGIGGNVGMGANLGSSFGPIGTVAGGLLGGLGSAFGLFKKKKSEAERKDEIARAVNQANDPDYYNKQAIQFGNYLGASRNWGLPGAEAYYQSNPQFAESVINRYGGIQGDWRSRVAPGTDYNTGRNQIAQQTVDRLAGPRVQEMQQAGMFAPRAGSGFGALNLGGYGGGYGGVNNQQAFRLMPGA